MIACLVLPRDRYHTPNYHNTCLPLPVLPLLFKPCDTPETCVQYPTYIKADR